jgi:hypothetical protein
MEYATAEAGGCCEDEGARADGTAVVAAETPSWWQFGRARRGKTLMLESVVVVQSAGTASALQTSVEGNSSCIQTDIFVGSEKGDAYKKEKKKTDNLN